MKVIKLLPNLTKNRIPLILGGQIMMDHMGFSFCLLNSLEFQGILWLKSNKSAHEMWKIKSTMIDDSDKWVGNSRRLGP